MMLFFAIQQACSGSSLMLRCDYDIQQKGIHFCNILNLQYDSAKVTPIAFYNQYRTMITNNLSRRNDVIKFKDNLTLVQDEKMSTMLEDLVLLNTIREIDPRLPAHVRSHSAHKMSKLMDFKMISWSTLIRNTEEGEAWGTRGVGLSYLHWDLLVQPDPPLPF